MSTITLDSRLDGAVGGRTAAVFEKAFGYRTVRDLLWHFPRRYSERGELTPLMGLPVGEHVTVLAQVLDVRSRSMQRGGNLLEVRITDGLGELRLTFFNQPWRANQLASGARGIFAGKVTEYRGYLQLQHPDFVLLSEEDPQTGTVIGAEREDLFDEAAALAFSTRPVPIYPATAKLPSWTIQRSVEIVLKQMLGEGLFEDPLPADVKAAAGVIALGPAIQLIHMPEVRSDWQNARDSLRFREAFDLQLALLDRRRRMGELSTTARPRVRGGMIEAFDAALPFALTPEQQEASETISRELALPNPMHRLLQGEVGSGKTVVALRAMLQVAESEARLVVSGSMLSQGVDQQAELSESPGQPGKSELSEAPGQPEQPELPGQPELPAPPGPADLPDQLDLLANPLTMELDFAEPGTAALGGQSALLAPTEVLASQHFRSITEALGPTLTEALRPVLLTSKMPAAERRRSLLAVASGQAHIVVGTHALLSEGVSFYDLGLIVVDEQHRFGVEQREALRLKGMNPHVLAMTATPIPRTVALTAFGDLETSFIRGLPPGRQGIESFAVPVQEKPGWAERAWVRALEEIAAGRQVYVVCPAISGSKREDGDDEIAADFAASDGDGPSKTPLASVEQTLAELQARPDYRGVRIAALTGAMKAEEKDRVMRAFAAGEIDLLVATTVIEVGVNVPNASMMIVRDAERFGVSQLHQLRGRVGRGELPGLCLLLTNAPQGTVARERVEAVAATTDGFELAEQDLQFRREGDILGTAQSGGRSTLRLLRVAEHGEVIERARELAGELLRRDPLLHTAPLLAARLANEAEQKLLDNLAKS